MKGALKQLPRKSKSPLRFDEDYMRFVARLRPVFKTAQYRKAA
jgi:hypothetical protein